MHFSIKNTPSSEPGLGNTTNKHHMALLGGIAEQEATALEGDVADRGVRLLRHRLRPLDI
jgi:hypothetical protein